MARAGYRPVVEYCGGTEIGGAYITQSLTQPSAPAVFSTPEIGTVGLSEADARAKGHALDIYKAKFRPMKATLSGAQDRMIMKLVVDQVTQKVLGVHVLGPDAGEMIQMAAIAHPKLLRALEA